MGDSASSAKSGLGLPSKLPLYTSPDGVAKYLRKCHELFTWQLQERPAAKAGTSNTFVLQDGPPYANGSLHIGHAVNKTIKDIICRAKVAQGMRVDFVPGSDCHGLPIELKVLEILGLRQQENVDPYSLELRSKAKSYVQDVVEEHIQVFKSWGLMADWDNHWKTMDQDFELRELRIFQTVAKRGLIFRSNQPVYWSPSTHTALAEAELEYEDSDSTAVFIKFPLTTEMDSRPLNVVVWTAEPWTLPANQAIAVSRNLKYVVACSKRHGNLIIAESRLGFLKEKLHGDLAIINEIPSRILTEQSYSNLSVFDDGLQKRRIIYADFVTATTGTGLVHCAPGHDFDAYQALQSRIHAGTVENKSVVDDFGRFTEAACPTNPALLQGQFCLEEGTESILKFLRLEGTILASYKLRRQHPIDWRSKGSVIIRATTQWFLDISWIKSDILAALERVQFQPASGKAQLLSFIGKRNDWCISRQRPWGVPLPALYHKETGEAILTNESVDHIIKVIEERGVDAWWSDPADDPAWLPNGLAASEYVRGKDTLDVWFDNGSSWSRLAPLLNENVSKTDFRADVYFEGRDQHRCWFQVSVLTSIAFQKSEHPDRPAHAPFRRLMTHGFALDSNCRKMSKSLGNVITYEQVIDGTGLEPRTSGTAEAGKVNYLGPDVLRVWAASNDWTQDFLVDPSSIREAHVILSKYRFTIRSLLDMLSDFEPSDDLLRSWELNANLMSRDLQAMFSLLAVTNVVKHHLQISFEIHKATAAINAYVTHSPLDSYLELVKDIVQNSNDCATSSLNRLSAQITLYHIFTQLQQMLGPIVPLLVEESHDLTSEPIRDFAGHPFHRIWEPLEFPFVVVAKNGARSESRTCQLEARL